jgi:hypothetical protein
VQGAIREPSVHRRLPPAAPRAPQRRPGGAGQRAARTGSAALSGLGRGRGVPGCRRAWRARRRLGGRGRSRTRVRDTYARDTSRG